MHSADVILLPEFAKKTIEPKISLTTYMYQPRAKTYPLLDLW